jgi:capsular polysaccharide biosynthesis protein
MLKKVPIIVSIWRLLRKAPIFLPYYVLRLIGHATFPVFGARAPLRGYYEQTQDYMRFGHGLFIAREELPDNTVSAPLNQHPPGIFVAIIPNARTIYNSGAVVSPDHRLLADVSWDDLPPGRSRLLHHPLLRNIVLPKSAYIAGSAAVVTSWLHENYYHWLFDILPRFGVLNENEIVPDYYIVNTDLPFQKESLGLLGILSSKIICPSMSTNIKFDKLIIPSLPGPVLSGIGPQPTMFSCKFLRSAFISKERAVTPHRSLYITRADAKERRLINEAEVLELVHDFGFEIVLLSETPFLDQVALFSEAKITVGPHGAGLSNAVFCRPGTTLVEFMPESRPIGCFDRLAQIVGLDYHSMIGREENLADSAYGQIADLDELRKLLGRLLGTGGKASVRAVGGVDR